MHPTGGGHLEVVASANPPEAVLRRVRESQPDVRDASADLHPPAVAGR